MRLKKTMSLLIAAAMLAGTFTAVGSISAYADGEDSAPKSVDTLEVGKFATYPTYDGDDLGAVYSPEKTTFKVWAPTASSMELYLYDKGDSETAQIIPMELDKSTGVWSTAVERDLKNTYYTYFVKNELHPKGIEVVDIYAKAAGVNGNRGMVVDLDSTDPAGWENDKHVMTDEVTDATVWEVHIKDFSYDPESGVSEKNRGKYLAFTEFETTLNNAGDVKTCMNYLKDLGVSYVQINPMYDFGSVDEAGDDTQFNWGYDPKNYNVPEGSYSSNPYDGNVRINEMKQMIKALHDNGIGVIMDVVYNHTYASTDSWFNLTEPGYYYRQTATGDWSNGSGCGNDTASEREMFKNFMVDSVVYWTNEYHIDGFRFDLMGLHDCDTMNAIRDELDKIDTRIITYGEGWTLGTTTDKTNWAGNRTQLCEQAKCMRVSERIGFFNDDARDAIKGKAFDDLTSPGFVSDEKGSFASKLYDSIKGHYDGGVVWKTLVPGQNVMYSCCHDNQTLYDRLVASTYGTDTNMYGVRDENFVANNKLAGAIVMTSQGMPFILAGEEFARTKYGDHNSYKSSPDINMLDWSRVADFADVVSYYKGCIDLRKNFDAFSDGTHTAGDSMQKFDVPAGVIGYSLDNLAGAQGQWSNVLVYFNGTGKDVEVTLPGGAAGTEMGDVDGDGKVSAKDALVILRYTINLTKLSDEQLALADVDGDGKVSGKDAMLIQRFTINLAKLPSKSGAAAKEYVVVANEKAAGLLALDTVSGKATVKKSAALILVPKDSFDAANLEDKANAYVEVKHVDKATGEVFFTSTIKGVPGQAYVTSPATNLAVEYDVDSTSDNTSGKMTEGTTTVYYYYVPFPGGIGTVTVKHVDQDGKALADPAVTRARNGDTYKTTFKNFNWYELDKDRLPINAEGTYNGDIEVVYIYKYNKPDRTEDYVQSTIHLKITGEDFHPNFYLWDPDLKNATLPEATAWPGNKLTKDANGWYNFTFNNYNTYCWIVNGDNGQSPDMVGTGDLWVVADSSPQSIVVYKENPFGDEDKPAEGSTSVETVDLPERSEEPVKSTIHVMVDDDAFVPCLYIWDPKTGDQLAKAWPGTKLTEFDEDAWYTFTFENYNDYNWIVNNGLSDQSADMVHYSGDIWVVVHKSAADVTVTKEKP